MAENEPDRFGASSRGRDERRPQKRPSRRPNDRRPSVSSKRTARSENAGCHGSGRRGEAGDTAERAARQARADRAAREERLGRTSDEERRERRGRPDRADRSERRETREPREPRASRDRRDRSVQREEGRPGRPGRRPDAGRPEKDVAPAHTDAPATSDKNASDAPASTSQPVLQQVATPVSPSGDNPVRNLFYTVAIAAVALFVIVFSSEGLSANMPDYAAIVEKYSRSIAAISAQHNTPPPSEPVPVSLTVTFAGDCTLGTDEAFDYSRSFNAKFANVEPAYFLQNVADIFGADDLTVVNMEGTLTDATTRADKTFAFRGDSDYAKVFSSSSVEAASMANNHSHDYGDQSYDDTIEALDAEGIETFGYDRIAYMDVKGVKVALVGVYELAQNAAIRDEMVERISEAKAGGAQLTLVYIHWGVERESAPNDTQMMLGRAAIDAGADVVVGSHPHVIQGWEVYKGRYIVYSLGNFCFGGNDSPSDTDCMIFQQTFTVTGDEVERDNDVDFIACSVTSASGYNNYQPTPATGDEKTRIDAKIQASTDAIAARAAAMS